MRRVGMIGGMGLAALAASLLAAGPIDELQNVREPARPRGPSTKPPAPTRPARRFPWPTDADRAAHEAAEARRARRNAKRKLGLR